MNLLELFGGRIFRIPDYQRGYAWEEKQLTELWDDLDEITEENGEYKKHYAGTIYLEETQAIAKEKWLSGVKFYDVVDGQQRLTTISIFIFELLKLAENGYSGESKDDLIKTYLCKTNSTGNSTVYKFSYAELNKNHSFLIGSVFENNLIIQPKDNLNLYTKNLTTAKKFFADKIATLPHEEKEILFKKLTTSLQFDIKNIEKDLDVQAVFETMNNRGKSLSTLEKLKNRLIYLTEKLNGVDVPVEARRTLREKINESWGKIYDCLAKNPDQILDEDVFLSAHLSLYRKTKEAVFSEKEAEKKVFQMFCNKSEKFDKDDGGKKEDPVTYKKIEDYVVKLSDAAAVWYDIHNSNLRIIQRILSLNCGRELNVFLLALSIKEKNGHDISQVLVNLEKILFRKSIPSLDVVDERTIASWGRDIYLDEDGLNNLNEKMLEIIQRPIHVQNLIQAMNSLFNYERGNKGFHRWNGLKYFLFEYEEHLKTTCKEVSDKVSIIDFHSTSIEHIIPQDFNANWSGTVAEFTASIEEEEKIIFARKVLLNSLGNLTILSGGKNASLGNKSWAEKKVRFSTGSYNEIDISKNINWTAEEVHTRGIAMLDFLEQKIDGLKLSNDDKHKMLFFKDYMIEKFTIKTTA